VKTRLAQGSSNKLAKQFYTLCCKRLVHELSSRKGWRYTVAFSPAGAKGEFEHWLQSCGQLAFSPQEDDPDLGRRMASSLQQALEDGCKKVVLVGSDIPDLSPDIVEQAFRLLDSSEVVLGPAVDGGFYLVGATAVPEGLLQGIEWSTSSVLEATTANCKGLGLGVDDSSLPRLADIDTIQDLQQWLSSSHGHPLHEPIQQLLIEDSKGSS